MRVTFKVFRYNPETDRAPRYETYTVDAEETDRVLDGLNTIRWTLDGTLALRRSCQHGVCGSDVMRINGVNRLACKVLIRDVEQPIVVEPVLGFRVLKDLVVDLEPFFRSVHSVLPFLLTKSPDPPKERLQTPEERERYDDTTKCILCAACTTSCPAFWLDPEFVGPAAIVQAHRFLFDSRDEGTAERLERLAGRHGVWRCHTVYNCTQACPRGIEVTKAIAEVKRALLLRRA